VVPAEVLLDIQVLWDIATYWLVNIYELLIVHSAFVFEINHFNLNRFILLDLGS
jgi:hypothetical protein